MPAEVNKCESCRFFHRHAEANPDRPGQCRRFPPERISSTASAWPMVAPEDGCGEHTLSHAAFMQGIEATIQRVSQMDDGDTSSPGLLSSPDPYAILPGKEDPKS